MYVMLMVFATIGFTTAGKALDVDVSAPVSVTSTTGYETEYIFRGQKVGNAILTQGALLDYDNVVNLDINGIWNTVPTEKKASLGEVDTSLYLTVPVRAFSLSLGETLYYYPKSHVIAPHVFNTTEEFVSLTYGSFFNPSVEVAYNNILKEVYSEGSISHKIPLWASTFSLVPKVTVGYAAERDALPANKFHVVNSYKYAAGSLDLVYSYGIVDASIGVRSDYTNDRNEAHYDWVGGSVAFKF